MRLTQDNVCVDKVNDRFTIKILMPDDSGNYLHCQSWDLFHAIKYRDELIGIEIDDDTVQVQEEDSYFRIFMPISLGKKSDVELRFHSRKLNLIDVQYERDMMVHT